MSLKLVETSHGQWKIMRIADQRYCNRTFSSKAQGMKKLQQWENDAQVSAKRAEQQRVQAKLKAKQELSANQTPAEIPTEIADEIIEQPPINQMESPINATAINIDSTKEKSLKIPCIDNGNSIESVKTKKPRVYKRKKKDENSEK